MSALNLKHYPDVCRVCLKADSGAMHSVAEDFKVIPLKVQTFLDEVTFRIQEHKVEDIPKALCDACWEQLTSFAVFRSRLLLTTRFLEALVDVKHSDSEPIKILFKDKEDELKALFKELSLCNKSEPRVEDVLHALEESKLMNRQSFVKTEKIESPESDDGDMHDGADSDYPDDSGNEKVIKPEIVYTDDNSSDDEPLVKKKKAKPKSTKTAPQTGERKRVGRPRIHPFGKILPEPWSCEKCAFTTKLRNSVARHQKVHEKRENRIFPCEICGMAFKTKVEMRKHGSTHPENQFICEMCGSTLKSPESLRIHMERHSNVTQKLTCEYCPYTTPHFQNMKSHMNTHSSTAESFKKECEVCKATFRSTHLLNRHMETHGEERKYACTECPARFKTRNALRGHRNCVHLVIRYPCEYCEKRFDQKLTLRDHTERVHNIQANFPCDICLLTVYSQEKLDLHRLRHENPKPLECGVCLTIHPSQEAFDAHLCISYREDYFCCARDYRNYAQLNRHMWAKHGIKTNFRVKPIPGVLVGQLRRTRKRLIRCRKCDITFPTKALKLQHLIECNSGTQNNDETYRYDA
ncbi:PR domain zinc finger protein 5 [Aedes aegypti]|uniref:Uncharacterized protein n=1 Tax=Aedes aegypti TaxID=7159 RepID=A0A6I8TPH4_AEDAE|nr:PR domain zinc finger protein 5 [Aedes aegypti]